jgi:hypothetical protein
MDVIAQCRLCLRGDQKLLSSHVVPAWAYRRILSGLPKPARPVQIQNENETAILTDKQAREHMLCNDCEQRLSVWENGECAQALVALDDLAAEVNAAK